MQKYTRNYKLKTANCLRCGKEFDRYFNTKLYCGHRDIKGTCSYLIRTEQIRIKISAWRKSPAYEEWKEKMKSKGKWTSPLNKKQRQRAKVIIRDNNACQICFYYSADPRFFDVDHKDSNPKNNAYENLWTLCPNCHRTKTIKDRNEKNGSWLTWSPVRTKAIVIYQPKPITLYRKQG